MYVKYFSGINGDSFAVKGARYLYGLSPVNLPTIPYPHAKTFPEGRCGS